MAFAPLNPVVLDASGETEVARADVRREGPLSYWQAEARHRVRPGTGPVGVGDSEIIIIGGGLAGLATALALKEQAPDAEVTVLEARFAGFGASGRNGGLISPLPAPIWLLTAESNPQHAAALRHLDEARLAVTRWIKAEIPEAELRAAPLRIEPQGRLTRAGLGIVADRLDKLGMPGDVVAGGAGGGRDFCLEMPAHTVQPYGLVLGLMERARAAGVEIIEGVAVGQVAETAAGAVVTLRDGRRLRCRKVIVCTNAYTDSMRMAHAPRVRTVFNYMLASERLPDALAEALAPGGRFTVELNRAYVFHRVHGQRIVLGGIDRLAHSVGELDLPQGIKRALAGLYQRSFGDRLGAVGGISRMWSGRYHQTATELPIIRMAPGSRAIVHNVGYGGTGVALTLALAPLAAAIALARPFRSAGEASLHAAVTGTRLPVSAACSFGARTAYAAAKSFF